MEKNMPKEIEKVRLLNILQMRKLTKYKCNV